MDDAKIGDYVIQDWPENPLETVTAYLKATYPDVTVWITETSEADDGAVKMSWFKSDGHGQPEGKPCASITISQN
jgi:hypothetical protein